MLWLNIDRRLGTTLTRQIYEQLRDKILKQELSPGEKLPSTRKLAGDLKVARNIVIGVYDQLAVEGYLRCKEGSGSYVAEGTQLSRYRSAEDRFPFQPLSEKKETQKSYIDFRPVMPDYKTFPKKRWAECLKKAVMEATPDILGYGPRIGLPALRQSLCAFLLRTKGIRCNAEQLLITCGTSMSFYLVARALAAQYIHMLVEDPGMKPLYAFADYAGLSLLPAPLDEQGLITSRLPVQDKCLILCTPSHQFPLGCILPIQRRIQLIDFARRNRSYIIENDYHFEFRYSGRPVSSLFLLDPAHVIHIGSFSGMLFPSLRIGYMVLPPGLVGLFRGLLAKIPNKVPSIMQSALVYFMKYGYLRTHIHKMKRLYEKKRRTMIASLHGAFAEKVRIIGDASGQHLTIEFAESILSGAVQEKIERAGIKIILVEDFAYKKGRHRNKIVLGYGNLSSEEIQEGIKKLQATLS